MRPIGAHGDEIMYFGSCCFRDELGFLNSDDIIYIYIYNEISLTLLQGVCCHLVVLGLSVRLP